MAEEEDIAEGVEAPWKPFVADNYDFGVWGRKISFFGNVAMCVRLFEEAK